MKRSLLSITLIGVLLILIGASSVFSYINKRYLAICTRGGTAGCLDKINGNRPLNSGDLAIVVTSTGNFHYTLKISGCGADSDDNIIPDSNPGTKCWVRVPDSSVTLGEAEDVTISSVADTQFIVYNNSTSKWENKTISGDLTCANTGVCAVQNDSHNHTTTTLSGIVNADLSGSAGITGANILDSTIANAEMADNSIGSAEMLDDSIGSAEMADEDHGDITWSSGVAAVENDSHDHTTTTLSGIVNADLSGSAGITGANILDSTIANAEMADDSIGSAEMADEDHGDVSWNNGVVTVEAASGDFDANDITVEDVNVGIWIKSSMDDQGGGVGNIPLLVDTGMKDGGLTLSIPSEYSLGSLSHGGSVFRVTRYGADWINTGSLTGISVVAQRSETTDGDSLFEYGTFSVFSHDGELCTTNCGNIDSNAKMTGVGGLVTISELNDGFKDETTAVPQTQCYLPSEYFSLAVNTSTLETGDKFQVSANGCSDNPGVTGLIPGIDYYACVFDPLNIMAFNSEADALGAPTGGGSGCDKTYGSGAVDLTGQLLTFYPKKYIVDNMATPIRGELILGANLDNYVLQSAHMIYAEVPQLATGTINIVSGLYVEPQTVGTANYGIILDGNGTGSDIALGPSQQNRIFRDGTTGETEFTGTGGLLPPGFVVGSMPGACQPGSMARATDSDDCSAGGGNGASCVCNNAGNGWVLGTNY